MLPRPFFAQNEENEERNLSLDGVFLMAIFVFAPALWHKHEAKITAQKRGNLWKIMLY